MREDEARAILTSSISSTRQRVTIAKAAVLKLATSITQSDQLIRQVMHNMDAVMPDQDILNPAVDPTRF